VLTISIYFFRNFPPRTFFFIVIPVINGPNVIYNVSTSDSLD